MKERIQESAETGSSRIFSMLRKELLSGHFTAGEKLSITALRERYKVGLSPLREALNRLSAYGLLVQENQRGFRVPALRQEELEDITRLRLELEGMALEQAIEQGDADWEAELLAAAHRLKRADVSTERGEEWERLHTQFHRTLVAPCGSQWLLRFIEQLHDQFDRYRRLGATLASVREELDEQHQQLVCLALARDTAAARRLMEAHVTISFELALKRFQRSP